MRSNDLLSVCRGLPPDQILAALADLTDEEAEAILYDWPTWARPEQLHPEGDWTVWMALAGRGWGKTRTGVEWIRALQESGKYGRFAIVGQTAADVRDVLIEGESGLLAVSPPWNKPLYEPSKRRITWPNGAIATTYSGDEPDQLRGPQHDAALCDELAKWKYAQEAWDNLELGLRLGPHPRVMVTTTPRPIPIIKALKGDPDCVLSTGSTYQNFANLAPNFIKRVVKKYEGTRLGRQELHAEILDDSPGALWNRDMIEGARLRRAPDLIRVVIGVDPNVSHDAKKADDESASETGIIAAGIGPCNCKGTTEIHAFVLDDLSIAGTPHERGSAVITGFYRHHADRVIGEVNNGGDLVEYLILSIDETVPVKTVRASRGKHTRAEPIAALYEQGRVHHVGGFAALEDQQCQWEPNSGMKSPDRLDALVWALTELMLEPEEAGDGTVEYYDPVEISPY